jgi:hypothetical protein
MSAHLLADDDAGYERWLAGHPDLYVRDTARHPAPNYLARRRSPNHAGRGMTGRF